MADKVDVTYKDIIEAADLARNAKYEEITNRIISAQAAAIEAKLAAAIAGGEVDLYTGAVSVADGPPLTMEKMRGLLAAYEKSHSMMTYEWSADYSAALVYRSSPLEPVHARQLIGSTAYDELLSMIGSIATTLVHSPTNHSHAHAMSTPTTLLDAMIMAVVRVLAQVITHPSRNVYGHRLQSLIGDIAGQNRHRYTLEKLDNDGTPKPFAERTAAVLRVKGPSGEWLHLRFVPQKEITALELYRCQQLLDGYVSENERLVFMLDNDLFQHFVEHG